MKLLTYDTGPGPRCGVLQADQVIDVTTLLEIDQYEFKLPDTKNA